MRSRQSGITLIGFIIIVLVLGFFAYTAMKLVPAYIEYFGVVKAVKQMATQTEGKSLDQVRRELMTKMDFQYVDDSDVTPSDIAFQKDDSGNTVLNVSYQRQIHWLYNIDFLLHFQTSAPALGQVAP